MIDISCPTPAGIQSTPEAAAPRPASAINHASGNIDGAVFGGILWHGIAAHPLRAACAIHADVRAGAASDTDAPSREQLHGFKCTLCFGLIMTQLLGTVRIGQLTGTTDLDRPEPGRRWPLLVDAEQQPLLTDTGRWGAIGLDLGSNTEHAGRLYIFFGDVSTGQSGIRVNADLVAWVDETEVLRHGGHLA